jgi:hypothetical protein
LKSIFLHPHNGVVGESPVAPFAGHEIGGVVNRPPVDLIITHEGRDFTFSHPSEKHWVFRETVKFKKAELAA